jgi:hypothetical protein
MRLQSEKPSVAKTIAAILSNNNPNRVLLLLSNIYPPLYAA